MISPHHFDPSTFRPAPRPRRRSTARGAAFLAGVTVGFILGTASPLHAEEQPPVDPCSQEAQAKAGAPSINCQNPTSKHEFYAQEVWEDPDVVGDAREVRLCESDDNPEAVNPSSGTTGLYQFQPGWFLGIWNPDVIHAFDPTDPWLNTWYAGVLYEDADGFSRDWTCARRLGIN